MASGARFSLNFHLATRGKCFHKHGTTCQSAQYHFSLVAVRAAPAVSSMAKSAVPTLEEEYENTFHVHVDDEVDSEAEDMDDCTNGPSTSKQNGEAWRQTDRYGFLGGDQYTDPDQ